ncbi:hypothetical protein HPB50_010828 [Hyalomma asiaticum]|uniref:Uncharacterized protein n=1 Tax=Hyalomma asiaticum TaxID=266040 RepID=A0ACB7RPB7_HYAAI|nr:hypothetical protein HPB50_010828 [Hyalomma asiaticum]
MAPVAPKYTLAGFAEDLDWKPLDFVKPLPQNRLCSVCGTVRTRTAFLPCGHVTCHYCHSQCCSEKDGYACPIDEQQYLEEDAEWMDFAAEKLLKREVKCWNQEHGCTVVMAASDVSKHFHRECEYHCTSCPRCSEMVLCRDMGEHLRRSCRASAAPQAWEPEERLRVTVDTEILKCIRASVQEQAQEMKAILEQALRDNDALKHSLCDISQCINSLKESVKEVLMPVGQIRDLAQRALDGINTLRGVFNSEIAQMKQQNAEELAKVMEDIESAKNDERISMQAMLENQKKAIQYAELNQMRCDFLIPGLESLEAEAISGGKSAYVCRQVYLHGYNLSPSVVLKREKEGVSLGWTLKLHKGDHDDTLQWPFKHKIRFTVLHPSKSAYQVSLGEWCNLEGYQRPTESSNRAIGVHDCCSLEDIRTGGYVWDNMLRVKWELL